MQRLLHSSKFWLLVLDVLVSNIAFFATMILSPDDVLKVMGFVTSLQPIFIMIIKATADEDVAATMAQADIAASDAKVEIAASNAKADIVASNARVDVALATLPESDE